MYNLIRYYIYSKLQQKLMNEIAIEHIMRKLPLSEVNVSNAMIRLSNVV